MPSKQTVTVTLEREEVQRRVLRARLREWASVERSRREGKIGQVPTAPPSIFEEAEMAICALEQAALASPQSSDEEAGGNVADFLRAIDRAHEHLDADTLYDLLVGRLYSAISSASEEENDG